MTGQSRAGTRVGDRTTRRRGPASQSGGVCAGSATTPGAASEVAGAQAVDGAPARRLGAVARRRPVVLDDDVAVRGPLHGSLSRHRCPRVRRCGATRAGGRERPRHGRRRVVLLRLGCRPGPAAPRRCSLRRVAADPVRGRRRGRSPGCSRSTRPAPTRWSGGPSTGCSPLAGDPRAPERDLASAPAVVAEVVEHHRTHPDPLHGPGDGTTPRPLARTGWTDRRSDGGQISPARSRSRTRPFANSRRSPGVAR